MKTTIVEYFANYVKEQLGIVYESSNYYQLEKRLEELAKFENCATLEDLYTKAMRFGISGPFKQTLLDLATNNETSFFRDPKIFSQIEKDIFPHFVKHGKKVIRIWSTASSFGQEIYSLLMLHAEMAAGSKPAIIDFLATDISEKALQKASEGIYSHLETTRGLTPDLQDKYFKPASVPNHWQVRSDLRSKVRFKSQNILDPFSHHGKFDLILCRNILIYQTVDSKKKVLDRLFDQLADHGVLIMGVGESMIGLTDKFEQFSTESASIYKKKILKTAKKVA